MKESKFYQEILEEGEIRTRRAYVIRVLKARFRVDPPAEIATALADLDDMSTLDELLDLAATCCSVSSFQQELHDRQLV